MKNSTEEILTKMDRNVRAIKELLIVAFLTTSLLLIDLYFFNGKYILLNSTELENAEQMSAITKSTPVMDNNMAMTDDMANNMAMHNDNMAMKENINTVINKSVIYKNKRGVELSANFNADTVSISSKRLQLKETILKQAVSASGARYTSEDGKLEFWNKGQDLTLNEDGKAIFIGSEANQ